MASHKCRVRKWDSYEPPAVKMDPQRAPASPPAIPRAMKAIDLLPNCWLRRKVSLKWELPASTRTSPSPNNGNNSLMAASVDVLDALERRMVRGARSIPVNSERLAALGILSDANGRPSGSQTATLN